MVTIITWTHKYIYGSGKILRRKIFPPHAIKHPPPRLWCDGSKLDQGGTGAAVVWKSHISQKWQEQKLSLGLNKEIFDAEMWGISEAFKIAEKTTRQAQEPWVINIYCDSQSIINNLRECNIGAVQALKLQIYQKAQEVVEQGPRISIRWIPGHTGVEGNKRANRAAKEAASGKRVRTAKWTSLTHVRRQIIGEKQSQICRSEREIGGVFISHLSSHKSIHF